MCKMSWISRICNSISQALSQHVSLSDSKMTPDVISFLEVVSCLSEVDDGGRGGVGGGGGHPDDAYEGATSNTCASSPSCRSCTCTAQVNKQQQVKSDWQVTWDSGIAAIESTWTSNYYASLINYSLYYSKYKIIHSGRDEIRFYYVVIEIANQSSSRLVSVNNSLKSHGK